MIDIDSFIDEFINKLYRVFSNRVWVIGLQGSYKRGDYTDSSDIDLVVILDRVDSSDIKSYKKVLDSFPCRHLLCGFFSGKKELLEWEVSDLFQFYHDTRAIVGSLDELLPLIDEKAIKRAITIGLCNIYHGTVHNMLYEESLDILKGLCKGAMFVMQALYFLKSGKYLATLSELEAVVSSDEKEILSSLTLLKRGLSVDFDDISNKLFAWSKSNILNGDIK